MSSGKKHSLQGRLKSNVSEIVRFRSRDFADISATISVTATISLTRVRFRYEIATCRLLIEVELRDCTLQMCANDRLGPKLWPRDFAQFATED